MSSENPNRIISTELKDFKRYIKEIKGHIEEKKKIGDWCIVSELKTINQDLRDILQRYDWRYDLGGPEFRR